MRETVDEHTDTYRAQLRMISDYILTLTALNALLLVSTGTMAIWLWTDGRIGVETVAMALPLAWQIANMAGWVADNVTTIFENVGVVQEGMRSIAVPRQMPDAPDATELRGERRARSASSGCASATVPFVACCTIFRFVSPPASGSA